MPLGIYCCSNIELANVRINMAWCDVFLVDKFNAYTHDYQMVSLWRYVKCCTEPYQLYYQTNEMNKWNVHGQAVIWNVSEIVHGAIVLANMNYRSQAIREFNCQVSIETKNMHNIKSQVTMTTASGQSLPTDTEPFPWRTYRIEFIQIWMSNMVRYVWTYFVKCAHAFGAICSIVFAGVCFFLPSFSDDGEIAIDEYEVLTPFSLVFEMHGLPFGCMIESTALTQHTPLIHAYGNKVSLYP